MSDFVRLPTNLVPKNYDITIRTDLNKLSFYGFVKIDVLVVAATYNIIVNSVNLCIAEAYFECQSSKKRIDFSKIEYHKENETISLQFNEKIEVGSGYLFFRYEALLDDKMSGFYKVKYVHPTQGEKYTAVTQFESNDARKAFPCWDEPAIKATYDITIIAEENKTVLSNMPLKSIEDYDEDKSLKKFIFERTPIMSTYLVAFVVGEYGVVTGQLDDGKPLRVFTPLEKEYLGTFALEVARKCVTFFTDFFGIEYPLPKLDLIAVPENPIEAMENWGLIISNQPSILLDPKNASNQAKINVAYIVTHEIAHQWFGNIVTMEWWSDLWLNEGFATWAGYLCTEFCLQDLDIWTHYVSVRMKEAYDLDCLRSSHPIEVPVGAPSEISEIFDAISYIKGGSILRMMKNYIGDTDFRKGVHNYLDNLKYSNAKTEQLWQFLSDASGMQVDALMNSWTKKEGFPVVSVSRRIDENNNTIVKLKQNRFYSDGLDPSDESSWKISIFITTSCTYPNYQHKMLFEEREVEINLGKLSESDWILLNPDFIGFYRTFYTPDMLMILRNSFASLNSKDRVMLMTDLFAFAHAGMVSIDDLLKFITIFIDEVNPYVWTELSSNLIYLAGVFKDMENVQKIKDFTAKLCKPTAELLGWKEINHESNLAIMCREMVLYTSVVSSNDNEMLANDDYKKLRELFISGQSISANIKKPLYAALLCDESSLDLIFEKYLSTDAPDEKFTLLYSMKDVKTENMFKRVLEFSLTKATYEDAVLLLVETAKAPFFKDAARLTWNFIKENWATIYQRYSNNILLGRLLKPVLECLNSEEDIKDVESFLANKSLPEAEKAIKQGIEKIRLRAKAGQRFENEMKYFSDK